MNLTMLLVDFHRIISESLQSLIIKQFPGSRIMIATDELAALKQVKHSPPDIVTTEVNFPDSNGIYLIQELQDSCPDARILVLSGQNDPGTIAQAFEAGADGYLLKEDSFDEFIVAIQAIQNGRRYVSQRIEECWHSQWLRTGEMNNRGVNLTKREREVLILITEGLTTQEIAQSLHRSEKTVYTYRSRLMDKIGVSSVAELTKHAIREGITSL